MILCLFCKAQNPLGQRLCSKCNAKLPALSLPETPESTLNISDGFLQMEPVPVERYYNELIYDLSWAAFELVEEDADADPFLDAFEEVQQRYEEFEERYPSLREMLLQAKAEYPEESGPEQALYLAARGRDFYQQGIARVVHCIENDLVDELMDAVRLIMDGSDHITHCFKLVSEANEAE